MTLEEIERCEQQLEELAEAALSAQTDIRSAVEHLVVARNETLGVIQGLAMFPFDTEHRSRLVSTLMASVGQIDVALLAFGVKP